MENVLADRASMRVRRPARLLRLASDERLVALVRAGDEGAFEAIYDRHHAAILGFCRHMLGTREEAEDAVQHTFLAAYRDLATSDKPIELRPWLFAIARNRSLSLLRARRPHVAIELAEPATDGLAATVERREDVRELLSDLARLPEDQRAALLLAELGALDHAGIATVLGCPREKVKALVFQARTALAANREARATPCEEIRLELATASGAALRRGPLRRHLRACAGCRAFKAEVAAQGKLLALALPVVPTVALKGSVLSGAFGGATTGGGAAGAASAAGAAGAASGASSGAFGALGTVATTGVGKVAVSLAVAGAVAGGGTTLTERLTHRTVPAPASEAPASALDGSLSAPLRVPAARRGPSAPPVAQPPARHGQATTGRAPHATARTVAPHAPPTTPTPHGGSAPPVLRSPQHHAHAPAPQAAEAPPAPTAGRSDGAGTAPPASQGAAPPGHGTTPPGRDDTPAPGQSNAPGATTPPGHGASVQPQARTFTAPSAAQGKAPSSPPGQGTPPRWTLGQGRASRPAPGPGNAAAAPAGPAKAPIAPPEAVKAPASPAGQRPACPSPSRAASPPANDSAGSERAGVVQGPPPSASDAPSGPSSASRGRSAR